MDWLHCNACYSRNFNVEFFMANCGHFFCKKCLVKTPDFCKICNSDCRCMLIEADMKPELQFIFQDDESEIDRLAQGFKLRNQHRVKLLQYYEQKIEAMAQNYHQLSLKYEYVKKLNVNNDKKLKAAQNQIDILREENIKLKTHVCKPDAKLSSPRSLHSDNSGKRFQGLLNASTINQRTPSFFSKDAANTSIRSGSNNSNNHSLGGFGSLYPRWKKRLN